MTKEKKTSLGKKVILLILLLIICAGSFFLYTIYSHRAQIKEGSIRDLCGENKECAASVEKNFNNCYKLSSKITLTEISLNNNIYMQCLFGPAHKTIKYVPPRN